MDKGVPDEGAGVWNLVEEAEGVVEVAYGGG